MLLAAVHASPAPAWGQPGGVVCPEGSVADIVIDTNSVFDLEGGTRDGRFGWAYRLANTLHARTDAEVVRRELLFDVGDCYDVELLRDSERLLRGFTFLANAEVYGIRMPNGQVQVIVDTQDEWSTRIRPRLGSGGTLGLRGIRVVEENVLGTGQQIGLFYEQEEDDGETIYGAEYSTPQMFGTRWNLDLEVARTEVGQSYLASVTYPFVGEQGLRASRQSVERRDRYFEVLIPDGDELARVWVPVRREQFEIAAAIRRSGGRYRHTVLGAAVAGERIEFPGLARFADPDREVPGVLSGFDTRWDPAHSVRVMAMAGQRNVWFVRRRGVETVNGIEDIQLGVEADASFGPTIPGFSSTNDIAAGIGLFAAAEPRVGSLVGMHFTAQAKRSYETVPDLPEWNDVLAEIDAWAHLRPGLNSRHSLVAKVSAVGGWHPRVPFQLTLGENTGLRGFPDHVDAGSRRIVGSLEHRMLLSGPFSDLVDLGTVVFADAGKVWDGEFASADESPIRGSVGLGLRAAFPPGSRQTLQVGVGFPLDRPPGVGTVRVSVRLGVALGMNRGGLDSQLLRSAWYTLESSDFVFPSATP
ncbi:MAG: BamA/TamA family outer membrane protein [Gemmatimonas sp.]|nr:BamA/TamA family outer membrane protein [Gemmatimonas sp.]